MATDEFVSLKDGSFHLDFLAAELRRADGTHAYTGPGYVRQRGEKLEVSLFATGAFDWNSLFSGGLIAFGKMLPAGHFWSFRGTDADGREWRGDRAVFPAPNVAGAGASGYVIRADFDNLYRSEARSAVPGAGDALEVRTFERFAYPCNCVRTDETTIADKVLRRQPSLSASKFTSCGFEFQVHNEGDQIIIWAKGEPGVTHRLLESRVLEALLFVCGVRISPFAVKLYQGDSVTTRISPPGRGESPSDPNTPIALNWQGDAHAALALFDRYFAFVLRDSESVFHPISAQILGVVLSAGAIVEAQALTLVTAVESILNALYKELGTPDKQKAAAVEELIAHVHNWGGDAEVTRRAVRAIEQIAAARCDDRLRVVEADGIITAGLRQAWGKLRHPAAHGDWSPVMKNLDTFVDRVEKVRVLFHQLIFNCIGYAGPYTDWGSPSYPLTEYPPPRQPKSSLP